MLARDGLYLERWFEAARAGLALIGADREVLVENPAVERLSGRSAAALISDPAVAAALARALAGETPERVLLDVPGDPLGALAVTLLPLGEAVSVTVRAVSEERLARETLDLALEGTATGTWVWDVTADVVHWSPNLGPLRGMDRGSAPRSYDDWLSGIHPDDRDGTAAVVGAALQGGEGFHHEFRVRIRDGRLRWLNARAHVLRDPDGRARAFVGLTTDVTERKRREEAAELLAHAGLALAGSLDAQTTLREIARLAVPTLGDWCSVHIADESGRPTRVAVGGGGEDESAWAESLPARLDAARGPAAVLRTGRSELWPVVDEAFLHAASIDDESVAALRSLGLSSILVVPVVASGRTLGAITLMHAATGRVHDEDDLRLAEELGRRAGLAMENATLHRAQQDANRRLRDLQAVTDVALTHLELDPLLDELLARVAALLEADIAKVLLYDAGRSVLRVRASRGLREDAVEGLRVPAGAGVAGRIAAAGRPLVLDDMTGKDVVLDDLREPGRSLAGVPLDVDGETRGVLVVSSRVRTYVAADVPLLELVADRAARAIRQAELYQEARDAALQLQRSLLPEALPSVAGLDLAARYLPGQDGTEVGGDWYDVFGLPCGGVGIVVGDVVGRGLRAAARMGQVRTALRAYAFESTSPADAIGRMDRLVGAEETIEFTTVLMVFLDPRTGAGVACSAGHLPPLVVGPDGGAEPLRVASGPPLGVTSEPRQETEIELPRGATLLAYTDGLVEDRTTGLDVGLRDLLEAAGDARGPARELVDRIVDRLSSQRASDDDVAIVAVGRVAASTARSFTADPEAVAAARHHVTSFAAAHGVPELVLRDVALAVSEACTNVVVHAYRDGVPGPMHIAAHRHADALEITVSDEGGGVRPRGDSPGVGLGLQIIARTTDRFDVRDGAGGGAELVLRFET